MGPPGQHQSEVGDLEDRAGRERAEDLLSENTPIGRVTAAVGRAALLSTRPRDPYLQSSGRVAIESSSRSIACR